MNKERLGAFIGQRRRELGLTQRELAEKVHVTDKAVSKWERGLSYPDVTLLEPLAAALELGVEELMACRVGAAEPGGEQEERPMEALMTISKDTVRRARRQILSRLGAVLALILAAGLVIAYSALIQREQSFSRIYLKETVGGVNYLYIDALDGHLLRLRCGDGIDFDSLQAGYDGYQMEYVWNRATHRGVVSACTATGYVCYQGSILTGSIDYSSYANFLFGCTTLQCRGENLYQDPYLEPKGRVFVCDLRFFAEDPETGEEETVLVAEDCLTYAFADTDGDGELEIAVRTRWPEKPYTVYDYVDGAVTATWPDTVPEDLRDTLTCDWER